MLMSPPLRGVAEEEKAQSNNNATSLLVSSASMDNKISELKERNYMSLSESSPGDESNNSGVSIITDEIKISLKETELRLGLPGSQPLQREPSPSLLDEKPLFPLHPTGDDHCTSLKNVVFGNKRGFSDAMEGKLSPRPTGNLGLKAGSVLENLGGQPSEGKALAAQKIHQDEPHPVNETGPNHNNAGDNNIGAPASKVQVVGWPPIRSFRKNSLAGNSKNGDEPEGKSGAGALYVKVSMDGAPYLRKTDLKNYGKYQELSSGLEKMFSCFTIGQFGSHETSGKGAINEGNLKDLLHGSEYVLTYEDKDGDWMLVGDVPWKMFIDTCKRLRIMKSSDAIGLAPRAMEKCRSRN
ncbi:PREDICTED: auxin-responsive protein IAA8-like isoform X1 [Tarenaya hassleriana]|uniref:auxin-responsive protein IAA8-like isoform X1 n=1 Tax=Tarenaya hassleriana TaxID=28532 RepID=UPI00053C6905|nr:PREDICTED: auxin-responsive protein IAA8-like isoform X1 [Tarenaya hassleriana]